MAATADPSRPCPERSSTADAVAAACASGMAWPVGLTETFYAELRAIAERLFAGERRDHTLQPTAVVNEACLRMRPKGLPPIPREQQLALAGRVLRQVLVDHARTRGAEKRGGGAGRVSLCGDITDELAALAVPTAASGVDFEHVHAALERLRGLSERQAEVVTLRVFAGLTVEQVAEILGVSKRTAEGDWAVARAWLRRELESADLPPDGAGA